MKKEFSIAITYLLMAAFTYGYAYKYELECQNRRWPHLNNEADARFCAAALSGIWPIYWPFHLSRLAWEKRS